MLKIVIFDSGMGGENFADYLKSHLPVVEIVKVIDWRHADKYLKSPREARKYARAALEPYIGQANLIVFANYFLTTTSLKYFRRKFKNQLFTGLRLQLPDTFRPRPTVVMATTAISRTVSFHNYAVRIRRPITTLCLDSWPQLIDDGELTDDHVASVFRRYTKSLKGNPDDIILACAHFSDIVPMLRRTCGPRIKIYDGFYDCYREICHLLKIRGGLKKDKGKKRRNVQKK